MSLRLMTVLSVKSKSKTIQSANKGIKEGQKLYDAKFKYRCQAGVQTYGYGYG